LSGADLREANLSGAILFGANLSGANLFEADLSEADLREANLSGANLFGANLGGADLREANLSGANLSGANLGGADLREANLSGANLSGADLSRVDLSEADLREADLREANLSGANLFEANLSGANLSGANLSGANLSGAIGLLNPASWLKSLVQEDGSILCYKAQRGEHQYQNEKWDWSPGSFLEEVVNPLPTLDCACGVNIAASLDWLKEHYPNDIYRKCRISGLDIAGIVIPLDAEVDNDGNAYGKFRANRVELLGIIE
jgi:uncharacterized protein YjbI with pentapeptide repeats